LLINYFEIPIISGTEIYLVWTPTVSYGSQTVPQNCQITWALYEGETLINSATSSCRDTPEILKLPTGDYQLVGRVSLPSGQYAQTSVDIPAPCDSIGDCSELPSVNGDLPQDMPIPMAYSG
jgi:hypothetical protein